MIIKSVRAQNVLKYSHIALNNIPEKGLIALSGHNESGKTAIVETICFALFGRTFSVSEERLEKVIRWNENNCQVELVFKARDKQVYRLERSLDYKGTHAAQLYRDGEEAPFVTGPHSVEEAIYDICGFDFPQYLDALYLAQREISTPHSQSETIKAIAGATDLEDVQNDLAYEAESEQDRITDIEEAVAGLLKQIDALDTPDITLESIEQEKQACNDRIHETETAINQLDTTADDIQASCPKVQGAGKAIATANLDTSFKRWGDMADELSRQMETLRTCCADIETDSDLCAEHSELNLYVKELGDRLGAFEDIRDRMDTYRIQIGALLGEETANNDELNSEKPLPLQNRELGKQLGKQRLKNIGIQLLILAGTALALFSALAWFQFGFNPDSDSAIWFDQILQSKLAGWFSQKDLLVKISTIGFTGLTAILILMSMATSRNIRRLKQQRELLQGRLDDIQARARLIDDADELPFPQLVDGLEKLNNEGISKLLAVYTQGMGLPFVNQLSLSTEQDRLIDMLNACMNSVGDLRESIATEIGRHRRIVEESQERSSRLDADKETIREREAQAQKLRDQVDEHAVQISHHEEHIETLQLGRRLLKETCRNIYNRFNQVLSKYTGKVMPKLTGGRYKQMQIADDLSVRVFSQEKNDFGELDEFSSGTQRQMLLAVRLAMSKALIEATEQNSQFIILDEPFAFFDRERIKATLAILPKVDKHLDQIWIITQEFDDINPFSLHIECSRDSDEMIIGQFTD